MNIMKHVTRFINCKIPGGGAQIVRRKTQNPIKTMNEAHQLPFSTLQLAASHTHEPFVRIQLIHFTIIQPQKKKHKLGHRT